MSDEIQQLFEERLARYQATIALEPTDRMIVAETGSNYFAEVYAGYTRQEIMYDINKWIAAESKFAEDFPEIDLLRSGRIWARLMLRPGQSTEPNRGGSSVRTQMLEAGALIIPLHNCHFNGCSGKLKLGASPSQTNFRSIPKP